MANTVTKLHAKELAMQANPDLYDRSELANISKRLDWYRSLRELADFALADDEFDFHGMTITKYVTVHLPWDHSTDPGGIDVDATQRELARWLRKLGNPIEKVYTDYSFNLVKKFGPHKLEIYTSRQAVCKTVVTGTKVIPAQPEQIIEETEYICEKIVFSQIALEED